MPVMAPLEAIDRRRSRSAIARGNVGAPYCEPRAQFGSGSKETLKKPSQFRNQPMQAAVEVERAVVSAAFASGAAHLRRVGRSLV